jgi:hypothetical protein
MVWAAACYAAALQGRPLPQTDATTLACCPAPLHAPATHGPHSRQAQLHDAADHVTITTPKLDRLTDLDTSIAHIEPYARRLSDRERECRSPFSHTPRHLRTLVLLI